MQNVQMLFKAVSLLSLTLVTTGAAQAEWAASNADSQNGSVALGQYLNDHPYGIAKLAGIAICFNDSGTFFNKGACKNTSNGVDSNLFSGTLVSFDPVTPKLVIHLTASRIFIFASTFKYEGDVTVSGGYAINGCSYAITGTPSFSFVESPSTNLGEGYIKAFHEQLTAQSNEVMHSLLGGYQGLPGFMATCK